MAGAKFSLVLIHFIVFINYLVLIKGHSDKWDENVRPKMVFNFLEDGVNEKSNSDQDSDSTTSNQSKAS